MQSLEFAPKLDWSKAQQYRKGEAHALTIARNTGLRNEVKEYFDLLYLDPIYQAARTLTLQHRWEHLAQKISEFSPETWERAGRVLSSINNGVKAALFVDIAQNTKPGTYMSTEDIVVHFKELFSGTQLLEAFGGKKGRTRRRVISYCQHSLCNVGLVTAEYDLAGTLIGFGVTKDGLAFGLPHALRLLQWENTIHESAYPILGVTGSSEESRAPLNCARILEYLFRHPYNVRETDLMEALSMEHSTAQNALERFHARDLVDYKAVTPQTSRVPLEYAWDTDISLGQARYITDAHSFENAVIRVIQQKGLANPKPRFSIEDIAQQLPEEVRIRWKAKSLQVFVSTILSGLARDGLLFRVDDFKGKEKQSDISLTQKGRLFILRIILPTLLNSKADSLTTSLSKLAQTSAELYYPYSASNKIREHQNNLQRLVQAIVEEPHQTARELAAKVGLSTNRINKILRPHIKDSHEVVVEVDGQPVTVVRTKEKGVWYYSL